MILTPNDLIRLALKTAGVEGIGQTPDAEDTNDCLTVLNAMLGQWSRKRFLIYNLVETMLLSTGAQSYTVGPGGQFDIPRPDRLEAAYIRLLQGSGTVDFPLTIIEAHEDYAAITMKQLSTFPRMIFYDSAYPLGRVYVYPIPPVGQYEIHLVLKNTISQFANLTSEIVLPPEYTDSLIWNLSLRIAPMFGIAPNPSIIALASTSLNTLRGGNSQIAQLSMPAGLPGTASGRWGGHGIPGFATTS